MVSTRVCGALSSGSSPDRHPRKTKNDHRGRFLFCGGVCYTLPMASLSTVKVFIKRYEKYFSPLALLVGFIVDNLTLTRIDRFYDNLVLIGYLAIAAFGIFLMHTGEMFLPRRFFEHIKAVLPILVQFAFGGLFSGYFIFYSRSGSVYASWVFIVLLFVFLVGNEFLREYYKKTTVQISILYFTLFSFLIFFVPIVVGVMGVWVFLASGVASLAVMALFLRVLAGYSASVREKTKSITAAIAAVFIVVNVLYFSNIIPPIPLSLKKLDIVHRVERTANGDYLLTDEVHRFPFLDAFFERIHLMKGEPVYVYSAVFAPTRLTTGIRHQWWYRNEAAGEWELVSDIGFRITGGRARGYRGYSYKTNIAPGRWRVDVVTDREQLLGRKYFSVASTDMPPTLRTRVEE